MGSKEHGFLYIKKGLKTEKVQVQIGLGYASRLSKLKLLLLCSF